MTSSNSTHPLPISPRRARVPHRHRFENRGTCALSGMPGCPTAGPPACSGTATGGWTLHQLRHSRLTHLAEAGVQLPILMAKSRHTSLTSLAVYAQPTFDAVAAATAALDPDRRH